MEPLNVDEMVAAKAEVLDETLSFVFRGATFNLPPIREVTYSQFEQLDVNVKEGITAILGAQAEKFWEFDPTAVEVVVVHDALLTLFTGALVGESGASTSSSRKRGGSSRRPSRAPTRTSAQATSA